MTILCTNGENPNYTAWRSATLPLREKELNPFKICKMFSVLLFGWFVIYVQLDLRCTTCLHSVFQLEIEFELNYQKQQHGATEYTEKLYRIFQTLWGRQHTKLSYRSESNISGLF